MTKSYSSGYIGNTPTREELLVTDDYTDDSPDKIATGRALNRLWIDLLNQLPQSEGSLDLKEDKANKINVIREASVASAQAYTSEKAVSVLFESLVDTVTGDKSSLFLPGTTDAGTLLTTGEWFLEDSTGTPADASENVFISVRQNSIKTSVFQTITSEDGSVIYSRIGETNFSDPENPITDWKAWHSVAVPEIVKSVVVEVDPDDMPEGTYLKITFDTSEGDRETYVLIPDAAIPYVAGNHGIGVSASNEISLRLDSENSSALTIETGGLKLDPDALTTFGVKTDADGSYTAYLSDTGFRAVNEMNVGVSGEIDVVGHSTMMISESGDDWSGTPFRTVLSVGEYGVRSSTGLVDDFWQVESQKNKTTTIAAELEDASDILYPTEKAVLYTMKHNIPVSDGTLFVPLTFTLAKGWENIPSFVPEHYEWMMLREVETDSPLADASNCILTVSRTNSPAQTYSLVRNVPVKVEDCTGKSVVFSATVPDGTTATFLVWMTV